ncbi:MAG TPA: transglycosylase SLT domain-containing protein [bacterium]|nr:transglycosylase SLT domain-containing protein [bacterium]HPS30387.1 transglycosylase SLT domain-containing protein [bacterium]
MTAAGLLLLLFYGSSFELNFEGSNIEDHTDQKIHYYQQFTKEEQKSFCENGDPLACKILFLTTLNSRNADAEELEQYIDLAGPEHRSVGLYLYITEKWRDISIEKLKSYLGLLPEEYSLKLYDIYLKKLYFSGDKKAFMENYRQGKSEELTLLYIGELLKNNPSEALLYLRTLKVNFTGYFYDRIFAEIQKHSKKFSGDQSNEFKIWTIEYNYRKVRYGQTIQMIEKWFPKKKYSDRYEWRAHLFRAMTYTKKREHSKAEAIYGKLEEYKDNPELESGDLYNYFHEYGYSEGALGNNEKSILLYLEGFEYFINIDETSAAGFLYQAADMARLNKDWDESEKLFLSFISNFSQSGKVGIAKFLLFWINYKQNDLDDSKKYLSEIISETSETSYDYVRALYWYARVLEKKGDNDNAVDLFCKISGRFPASFYGSLAASRIKENGICCNNEMSENENNTAEFHEGPMIPETGWIVAALFDGENKVTGKVLRLTSRIIEEKGREIDRLTASYAAKKIGEHSMAAELLKSISNFSGNTKEYFKLQYNIAFEEEILTHCDFYGVHPMFVFSIARQESLFNTGAVSSSYAIGLLQLLPETAQLLANKEGYGKITADVLKKPLTNARFGIRFLSDLLKLFDGSIALSSASYNAGPGRIQKWIKNNPDAQIDEFIEDIPIFQTRNYVKRVMNNFAIYHYIFEGTVYDGVKFALPVKKQTQ